MWSIVSQVISYLPVAVFAAGVICAAVTMQRQRRRSMFALIGFLVLLVGNLALRIYQWLFFVADPSTSAAQTSTFITQIGYLLVFATGLALLVAAVFAAPPRRPDDGAAPPAWNPPPAQAPHPGWPGGSW